MFEFCWRTRHGSMGSHVTDENFHAKNGMSLVVDQAKAFEKVQFVVVWSWTNQLGFSKKKFESTLWAFHTSKKA